MDQWVSHRVANRGEPSSPQKKETAAPAGPRNGGEISVGKPSVQKLYCTLDGWIKPDAGPDWIILSAAVVLALDLHLGGTQ
jgi:hypothetical protein